MESAEIVETTTGDLIFALIEEGMPIVRDENKAHMLVAFMLRRFLNNSVASRRCEYWN